MILTTPNYIPEKMLNNPELKYLWDDTNIKQFFDAFDEELAADWADLIEPAIGALTIAMAEWVFFRMAQFDKDPQIMQILEAAWCANIDRHYAEGFEVNRRDWRGPVRAPVMVAATILHGTLYEALEGPEKPIEGPCLMSNLVEHIYDEKDVFYQWRQQCIERLRMYYVAPDPLDDLYGEMTDGVIVPREAFDPNYDFKPNKSVELARQFLQSVDYVKNPFLCLPNDMKEAGFQGIPYSL